MAGNTTVAKDLRRELEAMASPEKSADDLANEAVSAYIAKVDRDRGWHDLVTFGQTNGATSGYSEADIPDLVKEISRR